MIDARRRQRLSGKSQRKTRAVELRRRRRASSSSFLALRRRTIDKRRRQHLFNKEEEGDKHHCTDKEEEYKLIEDSQDCSFRFTFVFFISFPKHIWFFKIGKSGSDASAARR